MFLTESDKLRFESKFYITPGCWIWTASAFNKGCGSFSVGGREGKHERASRVSYELYIGKIPFGMIVRHKCDNPPCVNPDHLLLGTQQDNIDDMMKRDRHRKSLLTPIKILSIKRDLDLNLLVQQEIALKHGISQAAVSRIFRGVIL